MGTHCYVGFENEEGEVVYSYVHYDGYPDGVGLALLNMDPMDVQEAVEGGSMRCIGAGKTEYLGQNEGVQLACDIPEYEEELGNVPYAYLLPYGEEDWQVWNTYGERAREWRDLREVLGDKAPARVQPASEPDRVETTGGNHPMRTNEIIGYRVTHTDEDLFIHEENGHNFQAHGEPAPIARGDAFRRLAAFLDANPDLDEACYQVEPVYRETTPIENAANELGGLFESLCARHGLDLGLNRQQINALLAKDLEAVKNIGFIAGIPGRK